MKTSKLLLLKISIYCETVGFDICHSAGQHHPPLIGFWG